MTYYDPDYDPKPNYPRKVWLQFYDDDGVAIHPDERTYSEEERVYAHDACYVRWGKTDALVLELDAAHARIKELESLVKALDRQGTVGAAKAGLFDQLIDLMKLNTEP